MTEPQKPSTGRTALLKRPGRYPRQVRGPGDLEREQEREARLEALEAMPEGPQELEGVVGFDDAFAEATGAYAVESVNVVAEGAAALDQAIVNMNQRAGARVEARTMDRDTRLAKLIASELRTQKEEAPVEDVDADDVQRYLSRTPEQEAAIVEALGLNDEDGDDERAPGIYSDEAGDTWAWDGTDWTLDNEPEAA